MTPPTPLQSGSRPLEEMETIEGRLREASRSNPLSRYNEDLRAAKASDLADAARTLSQARAEIEGLRASNAALGRQLAEEQQAHVNAIVDLGRSRKEAEDLRARVADTDKWCGHWQERATEAEADNASLRAQLSRIVEAVKEMRDVCFGVSGKSLLEVNYWFNDRAAQALKDYEAFEKEASHG
jgi:chromosome segregation ATPase